MTVTDQIFRKVAEASIPHFFITVEFAASGTEMPERIESFLREKHEAILRGASGRKFIYKEGEWRAYFHFLSYRQCGRRAVCAEKQSTDEKQKLDAKTTGYLCF